MFSHNGYGGPQLLWPWVLVLGPYSLWPNICASRATTRQSIGKYDRYYIHIIDTYCLLLIAQCLLLVKGLRVKGTHTMSIHKYVHNSASKQAKTCNQSSKPKIGQPINQTSKQANTQAGRQANKQAIEQDRQANERASEQASKQASEPANNQENHASKPTTTQTRQLSFQRKEAKQIRQANKQSVKQ